MKSNSQSLAPERLDHRDVHRNPLLFGRPVQSQRSRSNRRFLARIAGCWCGLMGLVWCGAGDAVTTAQTIAVTGAKIMPVVGDVIDEGTVLIRDGRIAAIGTDLNVPAEARVIDGRGKVVVPGFIEVHSSEGMSQANENNPNVPYLSVLDTIDPRRPYFDDARRNGVTTVSITPANSTMIGGQGAIIKTGETFLDAMILQRVSGMKISLSPAGGASRMGHLAALRKELADARKLAFPETKTKDLAKPKNDKSDEKTDSKTDPKTDPEQKTDSGETDADAKQGDSDEGSKNDNKTPSESEKEPEVDPLRQPMVDLVKGKMGAFIHCELPIDVGHALKLIEEFELKPILVLGRACYKMADQIVASGLPFVLDSDLVFWERDPRTNRENQVIAIEHFLKAETPIAFSVGRSGSDTIGKNYLWYQAATAVKYGMDRDRALQALTIEPAKMLGVDEFVGSLEVGKDGDLLILSGDPLSVDTWVDYTIINGKIVYDRSDDPKLQILLEGKQ